MPDDAALDALPLLRPAHYERCGYPHDAWARLRREAPVRWYERGAGIPFWAVVSHADVVAVSRDPARFSSHPRFKIPVDPEPPGGLPQEVRTLATMDPPDHGRYRALVSRRFTPSALRAMRPAVERIADGLVASLGDGPGEATLEFVERIAAPLPIAAIAAMLGLPREDWGRLYDWTNAIVGNEDPEYAREGESGADAYRRAQRELFGYFAALSEERRRRPGDDLVSALACARLGGAPLPELERLSYYLILIAAGNETTRNAASGGMLAFAEHPREWECLRREPRRLAAAVEEVLRWTSPVVHFARRATVDCALGGARIRAGDPLAIFYPSANRDEAVFEDPWTFRIDRTPNQHLAFGVGEHVCLGANLARLELAALFGALARRVERIELAGPFVRLHSCAVGGIKRLPLRLRLAAA
jgi:cytochrome P450